MITDTIYTTAPSAAQDLTSISSLAGEIGVVYKTTIGTYKVWANGRSLTCALASHFHASTSQTSGGASRQAQRRPKPAPRSKNPVAKPESIVVGDLVRLEERQSGAGLILEALPRRNKLARRSAVPMPSAQPYEQVIVANMDQVVPVFSVADPEPKWGMLDRYLVSAESAGIPARICINKLDLAPTDQSDEFWQVLEDYRQVGYPVILVSAVTGAGLDDLRQALQGRFSVFLGKSGVGKSTLLNALQPGLGLRVNAISQATGKGKHTTTHLEMFSLQPLPAASLPPGSQAQFPPGSAGAIVDTPGVREFGLWDVQGDDLAYFFPEMRPWIGRCRFGLKCQHDEEPGCAIRAAVMSGKVSPRRYQSYMRLRQET